MKILKLIFIGSIVGLLIGVSLILYLPQKNEKSVQPVNNYTEKGFVIKLPSLKIEAPVIEGVNPANEEEYNKALTGGVALMPSQGKLGESGNTVIYGHSSALQKSPYQKIFATLNDLSSGDEISVYKNGQTYLYKVDAKRIVEANDLTVLNNTKEETLTLMTCWPLGTDEKRLIITAIR